MFPPVLESRPDSHLVWSNPYYIPDKMYHLRSTGGPPSKKKIKYYLYYKNKVISLCTQLNDNIMAHYLFSQDQDMIVATFDKFDREQIKKEIIEYLKVCPLDTVEHCRDFTKTELKRFYGYQILNVYRVNPKNKKVSLIVTRGKKEYYRSIEK